VLILMLMLMKWKWELFGGLDNDRTVWRRNGLGYVLGSWS
jgi:hypothetical protein